MTLSTPFLVMLYGSAREGLSKKARSECTRNSDETARSVRFDVSARIEFTVALHW